MSPNPETGLLTLPEVVTGNLAGKFGEISLYNQPADFELGSESNSNSTSLWAIACEPATQPSRAASPLRERLTPSPAPGYNSDSNPLSGFYSDSSYEFNFGSDPDEHESDNSSTEQPLS
jgi:hypothetical protein